MPVAQFPAMRGALRANTYSAALFYHNFKRNKAYQAVKSLNIHSTLRKDEWEELDRIVVETGKEILVGVMDLRNNPGGLRAVSIATSIAQYNRMSLMPDAVVNMNPLADGNRGRVDFTLDGVPVPFAFGDFQLDIRTLTASRQLGDGLDVTQSAEASYKVSLAWETMLFNGTPAVAVADRVGTLETIYGYLNHPDRNTGAAPGAWEDATDGYVYISQTIELMKEALRNDQYHGPYWLYVNSGNWSDLNTLNANTGTTPMMALRNDPELSGIKYSPRLGYGENVMVDPRPRSVQWVEGAMISPVEWDEKGGLGTNFRVIGAGSPLIKVTRSGQCGVAHFTGAGS
jgi:uncharacterized linocin/CFP29 family protein